MRDAMSRVRSKVAVAKRRLTAARYHNLPNTRADVMNNRTERSTGPAPYVSRERAVKAQ